MKQFFLLISLVLFFGNSQAQIYLQLEKYGSFKVKRYEIGDEISFKLKGENEIFRTEFIEDILPEDKLILFSNGMARLEQIEAIRTYKRGHIAKGIGTKIMTFGLGWGLFSLGATFADEPLTRQTAIVVGTSLVTGWLIQKIFRHRTYVFGKKRRIRILDLRVDPILMP